MTELKEIRLRLGLIQVEMATRLGLRERAFQSLETGKRPSKARHLYAARYLALLEAARRGDPTLAPEETREAALEVARLLKA